MFQLGLWPLEVMQFSAGPARRDEAASQLGSARSRPRVLPSKAGARILIVSDTGAPQVNGVVRTLERLDVELAALGHRVRILSPADQASVPMPSYPEIRLALFPRRSVVEALRNFEPDAIHIATEGPMGMAARAACLSRGLSFTTAFHTRFPGYIHARFPIVPESAVYSALKAFHAPASATMVSTPSLKSELEAQGFRNLVLCSRGVDAELFRPLAAGETPPPVLAARRPVFLYVGRLAVEKNVESFLALDLPGTKLVVGEGPQRTELETRFPEALFLGPKSGKDLAAIYAASDVFVFPSRTDTFGLVLLEALACGTPVAAYPVQGPKDVLSGANIAVLSEDLRAASLKALSLSREACRSFVRTRSWRPVAEQFFANLVRATQSK